MKKTISAETRQSDFTTNCQSNLSYLRALGKSQVVNGQLLNVRGTIKQTMSNGGSARVDLKGVGDVKDIYADKSFNIWDEQWEVGSIDPNTGGNVGDSTRIRSKNLIEILPNTFYFQNFVTGKSIQLYYYGANKNFLGIVSNFTSVTNPFITPTNAFYMRFIVASAYGTTYNNDICINESNTYFNGLYVPHSAENYIIHRVSEYEFTGNEDWEPSGSNGYRTTVISSIAKAPTDNSVPANIISEINVCSSDDVYNGYAKGIALPISKNVLVSNNIYNNRATMLAGKHIVFELATPTIEYIDATTFKQRNGSNSIVYQNTILPVEYQEVEYIESHGAEYIDTGVITSNDNSYSAVFSIGSLTANRNYVVGGATSGNSAISRTQFSYSSNAFYGWGNQYDNSSHLTVNSNKHNIDIDKNGFHLDGSLIYTPSSSEFNSSIHAYLFAMIYDNDPEYATIYSDLLKIYSCKIYSSSILVRNFVPCYRKSDNEVGLYDLVNGVFYTNQGTGAFTKGPCVDVPVEYQRVEYIESTGTQWIDTGALGNQDSKVKITAMRTGSIVAGYRLFGSRVTAGNQGFFISSTAQGSFIIEFADFGNEYVQGTNIKLNTKQTFELDSVSYKVDGNTIGTFTTTTFVTPSNLLLFGGNNGGTIGAFPWKVYTCELYDGTTLIRNFIPCYRLSDNVIGLFDLINGVFYTNSGSGTFLKGSDVFCLPTMQIQYFYNSLTMNNKPIISIKGATSLKQITSLIKNNKLVYEKVQQLPETYQAVGYLESTGTQYIDTGVIPDSTTETFMDFALTEIPSDTFAAAFGTGYEDSSGINGYFLFLNYTVNVQARTGLKNNPNMVSDLSVIADFRYKTNLVLNKFTLNGVVYYPSTDNTMSGQVYNSMYLYTANDINVSRRMIKAKLFACSVNKNGVAQRNFVPCYRKSDSKPGLYDLVNDVFYTNQGTGEFNIGPIVTASGELPLTLANTIGGVKLLDYSVQGAARVNGTPLPTDPSEPTFAGEKIGTGGTKGLALTLTVTDANGNTDTKTIDYPSVEPLRSASGVSDEINFSSGKIIRRIGIDRNPVLRLGNSGSYGTGYPAVSWRVGGGTTIPSYPHILSSHWCERKKYYVLNGYSVGLEAHSGSVYTNMPRANYRKYVNGATGNTEIDYNSNTLVASVSPGTYRCDFYDGTSTTFTLGSEMNGCEGFRDVVAVSRTNVTLIHRMEKTILNADTDFEVEEDYEGMGETLFLLPKEEYDAEPEPLSSICSHFEYADMFPDDMIDEYYEDPAYCDDDDYWYFFLPGVSTLEDFIAYLTEQESEGTPVTLCYSIMDAEETDLDFTNIPTSQASGVTTLPAISDDRAFDNEANYTLLPAMRDFCTDEAAAGRPVTFYYVLPQNSVTQTDIVLPELTAGDGSTTLTVTASSEDGIAPETGSITALCEV